MPLHGVIGVELEEAYGVDMRMASLIDIEGCVHIGSIARAIIARYEFLRWLRLAPVDKKNGRNVTHERVRPKTVEAIQIRSSRLHWIVARIMRKCLLQSKLVENPLTLVPDVKQCNPAISRETNVEREVHPSHISRLLINGISGSRWRNRLRWWLSVHR